LQETEYEKIPKRPSMNGDKDDDDDDDDDDEIDCGDNHLNDDETQQQQLRQAVHAAFQQRHECRTIPLPLSLQQSLTSPSNSTKKSGHRMKVRNQHQTNRQCTTSDIHPASFNQYIASPSISLSPIAVQLPPALILRGQYDFVTESNCRRWEDIYHICGLGNHCRYITITNCSHYGFLEEETLYGNVVLSFLHDHDGTNNVVKRFDNV
jgi:pimeloyl-ACP methyl ester carboxylesterase